MAGCINLCGLLSTFECKVDLPTKRVRTYAYRFVHCSHPKPSNYLEIGKRFVDSGIKSRSKMIFWRTQSVMKALQPQQKESHSLSNCSENSRVAGEAKVAGWEENASRKRWIFFDAQFLVDDLFKNCLDFDQIATNCLGKGPQTMLEGMWRRDTEIPD